MILRSLFYFLTTKDNVGNKAKLSAEKNTATPVAKDTQSAICQIYTCPHCQHGLVSVQRAKIRASAAATGWTNGDLEATPNLDAVQILQDSRWWKLDQATLVKE